MIERIFHYLGDSLDPYYNLAVEQYLMETVPDNTCILYLWQNQKTVVIGRNQNPWKECRTTELTQDGGHLARRLSGGGAVFHDLGNLNFTFLVSKRDYNLEKQLRVVVTACKNMGIGAAVTGRNDVTVDGRKISGNAFYDSKGKAYHHGTIMVDVDEALLSHYLTPSKAKLESKAVDSVRSRVINLRQLDPALTVGRVKAELLTAFGQVYGLSSTLLSKAQFDTAYLERLTRRNGSWEWNYGQMRSATCSWEQRFSWGSISIALSVEHGLITHAAVHTDAMEWTLSADLEQALAGCRFAQEPMLAAIGTIPAADEIRGDLCAMILAQQI